MLNIIDLPESDLGDSCTPPVIVSDMNGKYTRVYAFISIYCSFPSS